jgi:hemolysin III
MATSDKVNEPSATSEPKPSTGEEIANSVSHAVGVIAVLVAGPLLIIQAGGHGKPWGLSSAIVFVTTVLVMYVASTLYHSLPQSSAKRFFRTLEHCAIFLLIAGTYTPFTLVALRGVWGWAIFGVVWTLAAAGILLQYVGQTNRRWLPGVLYLGLAWVIVLAIRPLSLNLSHAGLMWLLGGGVAYTVGMAFFAAKWVPYCHFVWHLFVLAGTTCHFIAIWQYVI